MNDQKMLERIQVFLDKECGGGATADEIATAEKRLGITFSRSYRRFLEAHGWARFSHQEVYGLGADVPKHLELITNTLAERSQMRPALPESLVPMMNDGAGNHYCLDTRTRRNAEHSIVLWNHELGSAQQPALVSSSFSDWLVALLDELEKKT